MILASSKNFDNRLHYLKCFSFFFSRDFVLAFSGLFFRFIYKATGFFLVRVTVESRKRCNGERERLIDRVKKEYCFFVIIYCGFCGRGEY